MNSMNQSVNEQETLTATMKQKTRAKRSRPPRLLAKIAFACLLASFAQSALAGPFLDEVDIGTTDHVGHDHADETNTFGLVDGIDATCLTDAPFTCATFANNDFTRTEFVDSDFTSAIFDGTILSFGDITDSTFVDTTFLTATAETTLDDIAISQSDFTRAQFGDGASATTFRRAVVRGGVFDDADFTGTDLSDTQFHCINNTIDDDDPTSECPSFVGTDFADADLTSVRFFQALDGDEIVFSNANFLGANFTDTVIAGLAEPCLQTDPVLNVWSCMVWGDDPAPTTIVDGLTLLSSADLRGSDLRNLTVDNSNFSNALIAGTRFEGSIIADTDFESVTSTCELGLGTNAEDALEEELCDHLDDNSIILADFRDTEISDASFANSTLSNATFADDPVDTDDDLGATLTDVDFSNTVLEGTDFTNAQLTRVVFDRANLGCDNNPGTDPADFAANCGDCANFTDVFVAQPPAVDGDYNISLGTVEFDDILACSALSEIVTGKPFIADLSHVRLDGSSFTEVDVTAVDFEGASLVEARMNEAVITGVNFDDADLSLALFNDITTTCEKDELGVVTGGCATFVGSNFSFAGMSNGDFRTVDFDDAVFDGTLAVRSTFNDTTFGDQDGDGDGSSFEGATFNASIFDGAVFSDADLTNFTAICTGGDCASFVDATFTDSTLENANLRGADLSGTLFVGSDLSGADLSNTTFTATTSLGDSQIDGVNLQGVDLTLADKDLFLNITPDPDLDTPSDALGVQLNGADVSSFNFTDLDLHNWNFDDADITGATFTGADLTGAVLTDIDFEIVFPTLVADNDFFSGADLSGVDLHDLDELAGKDLSGANLDGARVTRSLFVGADLSGANLSNLDRVCDSSDVCAEITDAVLSCVEFDGTDPTDFFVRDVGDVLQTDPRAFYQFVDPDLSGVKLRSRSFEDYDLTDLDFTGADLESGNLRDADLTNTVLAGAYLDGATFCTTATGGTCATFNNTTLSAGPPPANSTECNDHQAAILSNVDFSNAPVDTFSGAIAGSSVACVDFTDADLSIDDLAAPTVGFEFDAIAEWEGAVLTGAGLRFQDFSTTNSGDTFEDFFLQLGRARDRNDVCTTDDDEVADIDPGADLSNTVFSCGDLTGQQMSVSGAPTDLSAANFVRTTLGGSGFSFEGAELQGANFSNVDFSDASLVDVFQDIATVKAAGTDEPLVDDDDVAYPNLRDTNFSFANLSNASPPFELQHVDLTGTTINGANLDNVDFTDAILDDLVSICGLQAQNPFDPDPCQPLDNTTYTCPTIVGATLVGASLQGIDFTFFLFADPAPTAPKGEFFQDVAGLDMSGVDLTDSAIAGMNFDGMNLTDAKIGAAGRICDSSIIEDEEGCASFTRATFGSSNPNEPLSFLTSNPDTDRFDFRSSSLAGATFVNALLVNVDFSEIGEVCTTDLPIECLSITGKHSSLFGASFESLDLRDVDFGDPDADGVLDFQLVDLTLANLSGTSGMPEIYRKRNFRGADFTGTDARFVDFEEATLASIVTGCEEVDDVDVCTRFDDSTWCGVDAEGANLQGSFDRVDAYPDGCDARAHFDNADFSDISLATANLRNATLDGASFDDSVVFCVDTDCVNLNGASLVGVDMRGVDLDHALPLLFEEIENHDLSEADFTDADISDKNFAFTVFDFADLSGADLRRADLRNASFIETEFALGGETDGDDCELANGGSRVDLRGADLRGADFSRARNFQRGCIRVDGTTLYNHSTKFPTGFDLLNAITIPEPSRGLLQISALLCVAWLMRVRRNAIQSPIR